MKTNDKWQLSGIVIRGHGVNRLIVFMLALLILLLIPTLSMADTYNLDVGDKQYLYSNKNYLPSGAAVSSYVWECKEPNFVRIISGSTSSSCQIEVVGYFSGPIAVTCTIYYTQLRDGYMYSGYCMGASHTIRINQSSSEDPEDPGTGYTITLDPQGGTVYPSYVKRNSGETYGDLPTPTRDGYIFDYWYYEVSSYENAIIGPSTRIQKNADHTLYAEWTPATYIIKFNGNGSTGGSMSSMTCSTNTSYSLSANRFTYTGRVFQCWNTQSNGLGVSYSDGQNIKDLASAGSSITLYAIWKSADKQIPQCSVTLGTSSYTYDGSEKKPAVTVRDGTQKLTQGTHFTLTYQNNINAGTASVTVTGIGQYSLSKTFHFTINMASQTLNASLSKSSIFIGECCNIQTNGVGTISFSSSNKSIATVNEDGIVEGIAKGNVTITITASGNENYKSASTTVTVSVQLAYDPDACGQNIEWSLQNGVLNLTGSGPMYDWPRTWDNYDPCDAPWYSQRNDIETIIISNGITHIGNCAFKECKNLTKISVPDSVKSIGERSFYYCQSLTEITIPSGVTIIQNCTFYQCCSLININIPYGVTQIKERAFDFCQNLSSINIPSSVISIEEYAFGFCSKLTKISIPNSVQSIGTAAFSSCISLTSIIIPGSVINIEERILVGCSKLERITLPFVGSSRTATGQSGNLGYLFGMNSSSGCIPIEQTNSSGSTNVYYMPSPLKTVVVTDASQIPYGAFSNCAMLTSIELCNGIEKINARAFAGCSSLHSMSIPGSVTSIGSYAFLDCSGLTEINISNGPTYIGDNAFDGCSGLVEVVIPKTVDSLGKEVFARCNGLIRLTLPFIGCSRNSKNESGLFGVIFGKQSDTGLTKITQKYNNNWSTRYYWVPSSLNTVIISDANRLPESSFYGCSMISDIHIYSTISTININAFYNCNLKVYVPEAMSHLTANQYGGNIEWITYNSISLNGLALKTIPDQYYTSKAIKPVIELIKDGIQLIQDTDFTVDYTNNTNCGIASITIQGQGIYSGSIKSFFNIIPMPLHQATISNIPVQKYMGAPISFEFTVSLNNIILLKDIDYTVEFMSDVSGNSKVVVVGMGNYTGTTCKNYRIVYSDILMLPGTLTVIDTEAFANSACQYVIIPDSCKKICPRAFANCSHLYRIWIPASVQNIDVNAFNNIGKGLVIIAPYGSKAQQFAEDNGYGYEQAIEAD